MISLELTGHEPNTRAMLSDALIIVECKEKKLFEIYIEGVDEQFAEAQLDMSAAQKLFIWLRDWIIENKE